MNRSLIASFAVLSMIAAPAIAAGATKAQPAAAAAKPVKAAKAAAKPAAKPATTAKKK